MQKSYKFALIGTSCVGKTTLLSELNALLKKKYPRKNIAIVPEAARLYFGAYNIKDPFSYKSQRNVQLLARQLETHAEEMSPHIILSDRSVIDAMAYVWSTGNKDSARKLIKSMLEWTSTYDYVFLLDPVGVPYKKDEIRQESTKTRESFHKAFLKVLPLTSSRWKLISGSKNKRLQTMFKVIYNATQ